MPEQNNITNSLAHTKWNCKYHVVFAPKYRRKVFYNEKRFAITHLLDDDLINYFESEKINILFTCDDNHNITNMEIKEA